MRWTLGAGKWGKPGQRLLWQQVQSFPHQSFSLHGKPFKIWFIKTKWLLKMWSQVPVSLPCEEGWGDGGKDGEGVESFTHARLSFHQRIRSHEYLIEKSLRLARLHWFGMTCSELFPCQISRSKHILDKNFRQNFNTTSLDRGLQCWILAQDSEIGSLVEPMVWVYIEDIDRSKMKMMMKIDNKKK